MIGLDVMLQKYGLDKSRIHEKIIDVAGR